MKWFDFTCHAALAATTAAHASSDIKALVYFTIACLLLMPHDRNRGS